jgi:hypothetical protein
MATSLVGGDVCTTFDNFTPLEGKGSRCGGNINKWRDLQGSGFRSMMTQDLRYKKQILMPTNNQRAHQDK